MSVRFEFIGSLEEVYSEMRRVLGETPPALDMHTLPLQELIVLIDRRCDAEGYDLTVKRKDGDRRETKEVEPIKYRPRAGTPTPPA